MYKLVLNTFLIIILLIIIVILLFYTTIRIQYRNYVILCARYNKNVKFLHSIPIKHIVLQKGTEIPNVANEATSYLHYLIKNYDNLPPNMIFIHDENESWHHTGKISVNVYKWINNYKSLGSTYYEFNNLTNPKIRVVYSDPVKTKVFRMFWKEVLEPYLGDYEAAKPDYHKCCAQFIVSRKNVRQHPKQLYIDMYDWLIKHTNDEGNSYKNDPYCGYFTGRYAEWVWAYIFTSVE